MKEIINPRGQNVAAPNAIKPAKAKLMMMPPTTPVAVAGLLQQQHIAVRCIYTRSAGIYKITRLKDLMWQGGVSTINCSIRTITRVARPRGAKVL